MKNFIIKIYNKILTQITRSFSLILAFPIIFNLNLPITLPVPKIEKTKSKIQSEKMVWINFDIKSPELLVLTEKRIQITLGESDFSKEIKKLSQTRNVISRERIKFSSDPGFGTKRALVKAAAARYGIDWKILEAVWQVETGKSWDTNRTSYAGATGPMQFLPSTFRKYAVDGNGDGVISIYSAYDSVYAAANLLAQAGATTDVKRALFAYNHSYSYVNKVLAIANSIVP